MDARRLVRGEGDQADVRVVAAQAGDRADAVEERHVQVDHDGVGVELVRQLDRVEPVRGCPRRPRGAAAPRSAPAARRGTSGRRLRAGPGRWPPSRGLAYSLAMAATRASRSPSSARRSTSARAAEGSTWGRRRSATRAWRPGSSSRSTLRGLGERRDRGRRGGRGRRRERALPAPGAANVRARRRARQARRAARCGPARPRRRPLGRARDDRRAGLEVRARRRALDRRARRPEHARDDAERQRARDGAGRRARPRRTGLRERRVAAAAVEPHRVALVGVRALDEASASGSASSA